MSQTLTKRHLLNILENIEMDEPIKVMVNVDHLEMFEPEPNPYLLASDIESLRKTGSASLSIGAGFNKNSGEGIVLSTTSTR